MPSLAAVSLPSDLEREIGATLDRIAFEVTKLIEGVRRNDVARAHAKPHEPWIAGVDALRAADRRPQEQRADHGSVPRHVDREDQDRRHAAHATDQAKPPSKRVDGTSKTLHVDAPLAARRELDRSMIRMRYH